MMNGTVIEMRDATVEFESYTDEVGTRVTSLRLHNDEGQHVYISLANPKLFIFEEEDGSREVELPIQPPLPGLATFETGEVVIAQGFSGQPGCFHPWPGCNCGR
jgi:hypothetical protein